MLPWLLQLAEDVRRSVRANLLWAFGYNAIALTLATCGLLRPAIAAALMAGSSLLIVARSLRAGRAARTAVSDGAAAPPAAVPGLGLEA
jgi:Cu2+-exporting ATPase